MLSTLNCHKEYKNKSQQWATKFFPRFDRPYQIIDIHPDASTVSLDMPNAPNLFPTFHTSNIKPWFPNNNHKFPSYTLEGPINVNSAEEFLINSIIDHKKVGHSFRYLVHFFGFGPENNHWIAGHKLDDNEALDT